MPIFLGASLGGAVTISLTVILKSVHPRDGGDLILSAARGGALRAPASAG